MWGNALHTSWLFLQEYGDNIDTYTTAYLGLVWFRGIIKEIRKYLNLLLSYNLLKVIPDDTVSWGILILALTSEDIFNTNITPNAFGLNFMADIYSCVLIHLQCTRIALNTFRNYFWGALKYIYVTPSGLQILWFTTSYIFTMFLLKFAVFAVFLRWKMIIL